jgi:hypothetical protein
MSSRLIRVIGAFAIVAGGVVWMNTSLAVRLHPRPHLPVVTLIEYSDFQCPFAAGGQPIVERLLAVYGQAIKYEYRHHTISFHDYAVPAARRYEAIREHSQRAADTFREIMFRNQSRLRSDGETFLDQVVTTLGYDATQIARESQSPDIAARLDTQMDEVRVHKLPGTPGYVLNGQEFRGPTTFAQFEAAVCRILKSAPSSEPSPDEGGCWDLVEPDWKRLEQLDRGELGILPPPRDVTGQDAIDLSVK